MPRTVKHLCVAVIGVLALSACGADVIARPTESSTPSGSSAPSSDLPAEIAASGTLSVMTDPTYAPLEFIDGGEMVGSDVDLMNAIGEQLGVKVEWTRGSFAGIIPGLAADRFDASIAGMYISDDKYESVTMVQYANAFDQILVRGDYQGPELNSYESLCGMSLTIPSGSTEIPQIKAASKECGAAGKEPIDLQQFESANNALLAVTSGRADSALVSNLNADYVIGQLKADLKVHGSLPGEFPMGITVAKDDVQLANAISKALEALKESGEYQQILDKWKIGASAVTAFPVNPPVEFHQ
jgi:polar amino acid transport system substrate-binding protein